MMRFIMPLILIGISVAGFFMFFNPMYGEIGELRAKVASYDRALSNSKALEDERDKLTAKDNSIDPENKIKLQKLLPDGIDNIRLILEIEKIALPYGMTLKDVKYNATTDEEKTKTNTNTSFGPAGPGAAMPGGVPVGGIVPVSGSKDYGTWDLEFSTTGTYNNFLNFLKDLESNLRIVDTSSIQFSSGGGDTSSSTGSTSGGASLSSSESYKYSFKIKTYWLKNQNSNKN